MQVNTNKQDTRNELQLVRQCCEHQY